MRPQPSMLPAQVQVPPDQTPLLLTPDPEEGKRREEKGYSDFSATGCESAMLCVLFSFIAALIVAIVIVVVEFATGRWDLPPLFVFIIIFFIVAVILLVCIFISDVLERRYNRKNNRSHAHPLSSGVGDLCLGASICCSLLAQ